MWQYLQIVGCEMKLLDVLIRSLEILLVLL